MLVEVQSSTIALYGKIMKILLVNSNPLAVIERLHKHDYNIIKEGHDLTSIPLLKQLVRDNVLAIFFIPVEKLEVFAIHCSKIIRKCILNTL